MEKLLELKDIALIPAVVNNGYQGEKLDYFITDRSEVTGMARSLPIFTSPMEAIVDSINWKMWQDNGIKPILPRTEDLQTRLDACCYIFSAFSIQEVKTYFINQDKRGGRNQFHVCIDCGNGHDSGLIDLCHKLKQHYGQQMLIMVGNISFPETFINYSKAGIDYVRVGMTSGSLVDKNKHGFHYPMASLIHDICQVRSKACVGLKTPAIIADGGITEISDILKAVAVGADFVMIGGQFASLIEAAGTIYRRETNTKGEEMIEEVKNPENLLRMTQDELQTLDLERQYYGNTDPEIQAIRAGFDNFEEWKKQNPRVKVSDTAWKWIKVDRSITDWISDFRDCVDYGFMMTNSTNWKDFKDRIKYGRIQ